MKKLKRAAAAVMAVAVAAGSMAGCSSTDYAMTADGEKINAGVYINFVMNEMTNQMYTLYYGGEISDPSECFEKQVDGKDFAVYVKDEAMKQTKEFAAVNAKFDELGLELSKEDKQEIADGVDSAWEQSGDFYEAEGISRESLKQCYELSYKRQAIFDHFYAEGGTEEVKTDEIQTYVNDNYIRYKCITVAKSVAEDETEKESENEEIQALIDGYLAEAQTVDFAGFDAIMDEYDAYQEEKAAEESAEGEDAEGETDEAVTELDSSSDSADESAADTDEESETETVSDDSEASDESAEDESAADESEEDAETDTESEEDGETEEEADPYERETVLNYTDTQDTESESYDESYAKMLAEFKKADYGTPAVYDDGDSYYLYITADIAERTDYVEDNKDTLLQEIKGDEFDGLVDGWVEKIKIVVNEKAIKRYTVKEIYDRQNEYYSSQGNA